MATRTSSGPFEDIELGQSESQVEEERRLQDKRKEKTASRRHWVIVIGITVVILLIVAIAILGDVFGVIKKDPPKNDGPYYHVWVQWRAITANNETSNPGLVDLATNFTVQDRSFQWDEGKQFKVILDVQDSGNANVKMFVHDMICCRQELEAGDNITVDSGYYGDWGVKKRCVCHSNGDSIVFAHQIRAKVARTNNTLVEDEE